MDNRAELPSKQPAALVVRLVGTLFFGIFLFVGGLATFLFGKSAWRTVQPHFWQRVPCTIVESHAASAALEAVEAVERAGPERPGFTIRYSYTVGGKEYSSATVRIDGFNREGWNEAHLLSKYRKGDEAICWVNPGNPGAAVLERESAWVALIPLFPMIFVAVGVGGIVGTWRMKLKELGRPVATRRKAKSTQSNGLGWKVSAIFFLVGIVFVGLFVGLPGYKLWRARSWTETPCTILSSRVVSQRGSKNSTTYRPEISYSYLVNGREYVSAEYDLLGMSSSGRKGKDEVVRRYSPGSQTVCYVDPQSPAEAVLNRAPSPILLFGLIPMVFVLIGFMGLVRPGKSTAGGQRTRVPAPRGVPVLPSPGAAGAVDGRTVLKSEASPTVKFIACLCVAAFWNGIISVFVHELVTKWAQGKREWFMGIVLLPFEAIGLAMLAMTGYLFLNLFNPRIRMTVSSGAVALGGSLDLRWDVDGAVGRIRRLSLVLEGREKTKRGSGKNSTSDENLFARLPIFGTHDSAHIRTGSARLTIPADTMHSFDSGDNQIEWKLKVSGEIARFPDMEDEFSITLSPART